VLGTIFADISLAELALIALAALVTSVVGGVSGYGTGALMPLVLVPIIGPAPVVPIITLSSLFSNAGRSAAFARAIDYHRVLIVLATALPTCVLGAWGFTLLTGRGAAFVIGGMLVLTVPLRRLLRRRGFKLTDGALAAASSGYGALVGGTTGAGIVLLSLLMAAGLEGGAVIGTDAMISIVISLAKLTVFGFAGVMTPQAIAIALIIGIIALPGSFLAKLLVERMPLHLHGAILDAVVIAGGATMVIGALLAPTPTRAQEHKDREFQECTDCPEMIGIPAGEFVMGSPPGEAGRFDNEGPQHPVSVAAFALGKYDVTSQQFLLFLRETGYQPAPCDTVLGLGWRIPRKGLAQAPSLDEPRKWPAVCLDWRDAEAYIAWLNARVRHQHPERPATDNPYRLPSEAEWEYAARAGTRTARWWGDAIGRNHANCNGCGSPFDNRLLADVDAFAPNPFGLYNILGNAWQWTLDCWHPNYAGAPREAHAWTEPGCSRHVIRGGSWNNVPAFVRSASRSSSAHNSGVYDYSSLSGFRVARDLP